MVLTEDNFKEILDETIEDFANYFEIAHQTLTLHSLRDNIRGYLGQADAKALGIVQACPYEELKKDLYKLYIQVIKPDLQYPEAPEGYKIMNCRNILHMEHEIRVCKTILFKKYKIIDKMIGIVTSYNGL